MSREILSPPIVEIGERRYRVNLIHDGYRGRGGNLQPYVKGYQEEDLFGEDDEDEYEIEELGNSMFKSSFHVPRAFYGGLIGQKGMTKKRIESESKTEITIPGFRATEDIVTIKGKSRKDVCSGRRRLGLVIESLRSKMKPTHFVCAPVATSEEIKRKFNEFKATILSEEYYGIDERLFIDSDKIHITLATCALLDDEERIKASQIFMDCKDFVANLPSIEVTIRGLEIMNDDPSSVSVLYACVESSNLQTLANNILKKFKDAHLNNEDRGDNLKMHMTIMNGRYRVQMDPASLNKFDARSILKKYGNFTFGTFKLNEIHLSQMHTTGENGFYIASGILRV